MALDGTLSNGPWTLDEDLQKVNVLVKYSQGTPDHGWNLSFTGYHARWNATDQVPERAIASGRISRWGNIDPTLGGEITRLGLNAGAALGDTQISLYGIYYRFALTSNFSFFLNDPANGDQLRQRDQRGVFGGSVRRNWAARIAGLPVDLTANSD